MNAAATPTGACGRSWWRAFIHSSLHHHCRVRGGFTRRGQQHDVRAAGDRAHVEGKGTPAPRPLPCIRRLCRFATFIDAGANAGAITTTSASGAGATANQNVTGVLSRLLSPATPHLLQKRGTGSCRICLWNCWKAARASVLALIFSVVGVAAYQILWCAMRLPSVPTRPQAHERPSLRENQLLQQLSLKPTPPHLPHSLLFLNPFDFFPKKKTGTQAHAEHGQGRS